MKQFRILCAVVLLSVKLYSQKVNLDSNLLEAVNVSMSIDTKKKTKIVRVIKDSSVKAVDQPTFVRIGNTHIKNGTIEVQLLSKLLPNAPAFARGFIGVAFRINKSNSIFECIYIRPTNGRAENQLQRNHSIQYFSYPDYDFERLRKEAPGEYETYADMAINEWIHMKIVVKDSVAILYLNHSEQPSLIVNDLKHGSGTAGAIGLWVDVGTEGYFKDLQILRGN
jgi:hypothetical protein